MTRYLPVRGKWLWATLVVLLGTAVLIRLGFWQLDRLAGRRAHNAYLVARLEQPPLPLTGQAVIPDDVAMRRATVRGAYDYSQEIVLRNQALDGAPGVHLVTPLRISGSNAAVLVDRGWVPYDDGTGGNRQSYDTVAGEVVVQGIIQASQPRLNALSPADPPLTADRPRLDQWFRVDIPRIQQQMPYPLLPVFVEEGQPPLGSLPPAPSAGSLPQPDIQIDLSDGPHLSYAIQWFSFAAILLGGYLIYYVRQVLHPAPLRRLPPDSPELP